MRYHGKPKISKEDAVQRITQTIIALAAEESSEESGKTTLAEYLLKRQALLEFYVTKLVSDILSYCHRRDFPEALIYTVIELMHKLFSEQVAAAESDFGKLPVSKVKMGDTEIDLAVNSVDLSEIAGVKLFDLIKSTLNLYRKIQSY